MLKLLGGDEQGRGDCRVVVQPGIGAPLGLDEKSSQGIVIH
jgi:hypothetical protein